MVAVQKMPANRNLHHPVPVQTGIINRGRAQEPPHHRADFYERDKPCLVTPTNSIWIEWTTC